MNTAVAATAMIQQAQATKRNVSFSEVVGSSFTVRRAPSVVPQKDGNITLLRSVKYDDVVVSDLDDDAAVQMLATWLNEIEFVLMNERLQARLDAKLAELGWN